MHGCEGGHKGWKGIFCGYTDDDLKTAMIYVIHKKKIKCVAYDCCRWVYGNLTWKLSNPSTSWGISSQANSVGSGRELRSPTWGVPSAAFVGTCLAFRFHSMIHSTIIAQRIQISANGLIWTSTQNDRIEVLPHKSARGKGSYLRSR